MSPRWTESEPELRPVPPLTASSVVTLTIGIGLLLDGALVDSLVYLGLGGAMVALALVVVIVSLALPIRTGNQLAFRLMVLCLVVALMMVAYGLASDYVAPWVSEQLPHATPTPTPTPKIMPLPAPSRF
jgi:hypothetical protein